MKTIPFANPHGLYKIHNNEILGAIKKVLDNGIYILGDEVRLFEYEFAKYCGTQECVSVSTGTDALSLSLIACGVKSGDSVIIPANSYPTVFAVTKINAIPQLVDCDKDTLTIDVSKIENVITKNTKAIIPVHLYGQSADLDPILSISKKFKIPIIEDCAQAHGTRYKNKPVGTFGDAGCFSFYPTKNLGCIGDGGAVISSNKKLTRRVRMLRMYGETDRYNSIILGTNSRLDELQAAILRIKLKYLTQENTSRKKLADLYYAKLQAIKEIQLPVLLENSSHNYHLFVIYASHRDELKRYLLKNGVLTAIHYPIPIHAQKSFAYLKYKRNEFPVTTEAAKKILSLPMFPTMSELQVKRVARLIKNFYS